MVVCCRHRSNGKVCNGERSGSGFIFNVLVVHLSRNAGLPVTFVQTGVSASRPHAADRSVSGERFRPHVVVDMIIRRQRRPRSPVGERAKSRDRAVDDLVCFFIAVRSGWNSV